MPEKSRTSSRAAGRSSRPDDDVAAVLNSLRVLDLATSRFRTATAQRMQVTVSDSMVMSNLAMAGGRMTPRDLAQRLMLGSGTLTTMLDRLESAGYVARTPNPDDRRSLLIELTERGRSSLFYTADQLGVAIEAALPSGPPSAELVDGLLAVARAMDSVVDHMIGDRE